MIESDNHNKLKFKYISFSYNPCSLKHSVGPSHKPEVCSICATALFV
jgi:hypothetical protein